MYRYTPISRLCSGWCEKYRKKRGISSRESLLEVRVQAFENSRLNWTTAEAITKCACVRAFVLCMYRVALNPLVELFFVVCRIPSKKTAQPASVRHSSETADQRTFCLLQYARTHNVLQEPTLAAVCPTWCRAAGL